MLVFIVFILIIILFHAIDPLGTHLITHLLFIFRDLQKYPPLKMNCYLPRIRLCQSGNIQIDSIVLDDAKKNYEERNRGKGQNGALPNPWVLHCHQKQMQKLQKSSSTISQSEIFSFSHSDRSIFNIIGHICFCIKYFATSLV